jgi:hypothetical protein
MLAALGRTSSNGRGRDLKPIRCSDRSTATSSQRIRRRSPQFTTSIILKWRCRYLPSSRMPMHRFAGRKNASVMLAKRVPNYRFFFFAKIAFQLSL